jgi:hypothetical protein
VFGLRAGRRVRARRPGPQPRAYPYLHPTPDLGSGVKGIQAGQELQLAVFGGLEVPLQVPSTAHLLLRELDLLLCVPQLLGVLLGAAHQARLATRKQQYDPHSPSATPGPHGQQSTHAAQLSRGSVLGFHFLLPDAELLCKDRHLRRGGGVRTFCQLAYQPGLSGGNAPGSEGAPFLLGPQPRRVLAARVRRPAGPSNKEDQRLAIAKLVRGRQRPTSSRRRRSSARCDSMVAFLSAWNLSLPHP